MIYEPVLILKPENVTIADTARIDSFVKIEGGQGVTIADGVHVASFVSINIGGGVVELRENSAVAAGARVLSGSNMKDAVSMSAAAPEHLQHKVRKRTIIDAYAFVGANAVVLPGVTVGEGAVVGAGAVVTKDVPPWEIWAGNPARKIGDRSEMRKRLRMDEEWMLLTL